MAVLVMFLLFTTLVHCDCARNLDSVASKTKQVNIDESMKISRKYDVVGYLPPTTPGCSPGIGHCKSPNGKC